MVVLKTMSGRGKIKETVLLAVLNIALPSLDIYSDLAVILNFYVGGSQRNMFCDQMYNGPGWGQYQERFKCYYDESVPSSNMKYTTHFGWGTLMRIAKRITRHLEASVGPQHEAPEIKGSSI